MKYSILSLFILLHFLSCANAYEAKKIDIVIGNNAEKVELTAAKELLQLLAENYPQVGFNITTEIPAKGEVILLGTIESMPALKKWVNPDEISAYGSFVAGNLKTNSQTIAYVCGQNPRAVLDGVFQVLSRKYGYGFAMSFEASEVTRPGPFDLTFWELKDHPLLPERFLFAWFNYLEINGTWNIEDWKQALRNGARLGFNQIFFHCYANDPLLEFNFRGYEKPVGWRNSSRKGRNYAVEHMWDVRNLIGGEKVFHQPIFGSEAALVHDTLRVKAARELIREMIAVAHNYGYHVIWGIDIDTYPAHPQEFLISTLPESARFMTGLHDRKHWVVRPDSPGGRAFYKSMLSTYLNEIPGVDTYMMWVRNYGMSPVMSAELNDLPFSWQNDYKSSVSNDPTLNTKMAPGIYYVNKVSKLWRELFDELGYKNTRVGFGSWSWGLNEKFIPANHFLSPDIPFLVVDYNNAIGRDSAFNSVILEIANVRTTGVLLRNKNDDGGFYGRPRDPQQNIAEIIHQTGIRSIGTYSYMPRPYDIYTLTVANQLWEKTCETKVDDVIEQVSQDWFGEHAAPQMQNYLTEWMQNSPIIGRTSGPAFQEHLTKQEFQHAKNGGLHRIKILEKVDTSAMTENAKSRWSYFRYFEDFMILFNEAQNDYQKNKIETLKSEKPEQAIKAYVNTITSHDINPGEKGMLINLHTRWLSWIIARRQSLGLEPVRIRFQPTYHDQFARKPGTLSFYMDHEQNLWSALGEKETGCKIEIQYEYGNDTNSDLSGIYLTSNKPVKLKLGNVRNQANIGSGFYDVILCFPANRKCNMKVRIQNQIVQNIVLSRNNKLIKKQLGQIKITEGELDLTLSPITNDVVLSGVILKPVGKIVPLPSKKNPTDEEL